MKTLHEGGELAGRARLDRQRRRPLSCGRQACPPVDESETSGTDRGAQ